MSDLVERIPVAIKATEYKYFGDYEFSEDQWDAVNTLVDAANAYLAQQDEIARLRDGIYRAAEGLEGGADIKVITKLLDALLEQKS